jgi:hypothetical protein
MASTRRLDLLAGELGAARSACETALTVMLGTNRTTACTHGSTILHRRDLVVPMGMLVPAIPQDGRQTADVKMGVRVSEARN